MVRRSGNISVNSIKDVESAIVSLDEELSLLEAYPRGELEKIIKDVGFGCTLCGRCCTKEYNDHVFLLTKDCRRAKEKYPDMIVPAPYFEICDNLGRFYVSGYALKVKDNGDCAFLSKDRRCEIYDERFEICRIYPYMLHREADEYGNVDWRQIAGLNDHGEYNTEISDEECRKTAEMTVAYEKDFLIQERDFYKRVLKHLSENGLKPVRKLYDEKMRAFARGESVTVFVYNGDNFDERTVAAGDYTLTD